MAAIENEKIYGLKIRESANDGSDFGTPDADYRYLFLGEDGHLHAKDAAAAVTDLSSGLGAWEAYTPTLVNATLGNGTLVGRKKLVDANTYLWRMHFVFGSTSSISGNLGVTLPGTALAGSAQLCHGLIRDTGTTWFVASGHIAAGASTVSSIAAADGTGIKAVTSTIPMTWATGDELILAGVLEI